MGLQPAVKLAGTAGKIINKQSWMPCSGIGIFILNEKIKGLLVLLIKTILAEVWKMDWRQLDLESGRWVIKLLLSYR